MEYIIFIAFVVLFAFIINLRGRVYKLERFIRKNSFKNIAEPISQSPLKQDGLSQPASSSPLIEYIKDKLRQGTSRGEITNSLLSKGWQMSDIETAFSSVISITQTNQPSAVPETVGSDSFDKFSKWLKEDWLLKLGALLLIIGFGWLTAYAFLNNWIGPMGRIALGIIAGSFFMILGWWRIKKYIHQGGVFLVLGSTTVLLTIFAAREVYNFFTPMSALAIMFLSSAFVALASVKNNSRSLALASLVSAGVAPLLTNSPTKDYIGLFMYLFIVVLGAVWISVITKRRELTTAGLIIIALYSLPYLFSFTSKDSDILLLFAYAFSSLFFLTNTIGIIKSKTEDIVPDLVTAAGNGLFLLAWIMTAGQNEWKSLIISAWMVVFSFGAFITFKISKRREPFLVYAGVGVAMLAAATSAELKGATLTIAYIIESGIVSLVAYSVLRDKKIAERISLLLIGPMILSFENITSRAWSSGVIHKDFFVLLVLGMTLLGLGLLFLRRPDEIKKDESRDLNTSLFVAGSIYFYALIWLSSQSLFLNDDFAVMVSLIIFTIIGLITYFYGLAEEKRGLRIYGGVLLCFVIGRLLLVDVWKMEIAGRTITFFLIGALLVSTAFIGKMKKGSRLLINNDLKI